MQLTRPGFCFAFGNALSMVPRMARVEVERLMSLFSSRVCTMSARGTPPPGRERERGSGGENKQGMAMCQEAMAKGPRPKGEGLARGHEPNGPWAKRAKSQMGRGPNGPRA